MNKIVYVLLIIVVLFGACTPDQPTGDQIIQQSIRAHGQSEFMNKKLAFTFRDRRYTSKRTENEYTYTRTWQENDSTTIADKLINSSQFSRQINGEVVSLPDSMVQKYTSSVNSVLYFVQLPYLLTDPAVNATYQGQQKLAGETYDVVKVTFGKGNGGEDFQDEYRYWFNQNGHLMDYLAYSYQTNGGGVRFRKAIDRYSFGNVIFQNYINYEVPKETPLEEIPELFEKGQLKELSRIVSEDIGLE